MVRRCVAFVGVRRRTRYYALYIIHWVVPRVVQTQLFTFSVSTRYLRLAKVPGSKLCLSAPVVVNEWKLHAYIKGSARPKVSPSASAAAHARP